METKNKAGPNKEKVEKFVRWAMLNKFNVRHDVKIKIDKMIQHLFDEGGIDKKVLEVYNNLTKSSLREIVSKGGS